MEISILKNFKKDFYHSEPYPHFEINNCLSEDLYNKLSREYDLFVNFFANNKNFKKNNVRLQISSDEFFNSFNFKNTLWYDFISYHTSFDFLQQIVGIFHSDLIKYFPKINFNNEGLKNCGIRNDANNKNKNFVLDCQPGINTNVLKKASVRGPHIDNPHELIGGLFYLADDFDNAGGDLEIFDRKNKLLFHQKAEVYNLKDLKYVKTVKYKKNNVFFFINSENSIHSVTERNKTKNLRRITNFVVERYVEGYNFSYNKKKNFLINLLNKIYK